MREQSPFTNDFHPFWSPDAGQFTYDSFHQGGKFAESLMLYKQVLDAKDDQPLNHGGQNILGSSPVWMHDDWIAFTGRVAVFLWMSIQSALLPVGIAHNIVF